MNAPDNYQITYERGLERPLLSAERKERVPNGEHEAPAPHHHINVHVQGFRLVRTGSGEGLWKSLYTPRGVVD